MKTKFDVGEEVLVKGEISSISIDEGANIKYDVVINTRFDDIFVRCFESDDDILKLEGEDNA